MRRLFSYILKHNFFFLFIILEAFSFVLIVQNNYQRASFINTSNRFTGSIFNSYNRISDYFSLGKANQQLLDENEFLRNQLNKSISVLDTNYQFKADTVYEYIGAKVISNSINRQKNYLMLNKGELDGIEPDMGVITSNGIVGTVVEVSEHFSRVMPVINLAHSLSVRIKKNNHVGSLGWDGKDYRYGIISDIPAHVDLQIGDTVITSGNSHVFPENILVGTIGDNVTSKNENFKSAKVKFSVDYNSLYYVYVIANMRLEEQKQLENKDNE